MSVLTFGTYEHEEDEVGIKIMSSVTYDSFGRPAVVIERWMIAGALRGNSLDGKITALEDAYIRDGGQESQDAQFVANAGTHTLTSNGSYRGVRCVQFGYGKGGPWKMRTELSNRRTFHAVLQAEYFNVDGPYYAFRESINTRGDGRAKWSYMPSLSGIPEYQVHQLNTPMHIVQRGTIVGREDYQAKPDPVLPFLVHGDQVEESRDTPSIKLNDGTRVDDMFTSTYTYVMESAISINVPRPTNSIPENL